MQLKGKLASRQALVKLTRSPKGYHLVELMVGVIVGGMLLTSIYGSSMAMYRTSVVSENEVLATNMAQQVIDNARNTTFTKLRELAGGGTASQSIPLYEYPSDPENAMFSRPLLRNDTDMDYGTKTVATRFNGTVTETITDLQPADMDNGSVRIEVRVQWQDSRGTHAYESETVIAQTGVHN